VQNFKERVCTLQKLVTTVKKNKLMTGEASCAFNSLMKLFIKMENIFLYTLLEYEPLALKTDAFNIGVAPIRYSTNGLSLEDMIVTPVKELTES
jgi:hypothetical protein